RSLTARIEFRNCALETIQVASGRDHVGAVAQRRRRTRTTETGTDPRDQNGLPLKLHSDSLA
ncbi:MAG: hypothetical protein EBZ17_11700, partial [Actinobacteria bacterium]|nr:hypothetical protein [Actinomycetota bacterium]